MTPDLAAAIAAKILAKANGCQMWTGAAPQGCPRLYTGRGIGYSTVINVRRALYEERYGSTPDRIDVCLVSGFRCVEPDHQRPRQPNQMANRGLAVSSDERGESNGAQPATANAAPRASPAVSRALTDRPVSILTGDESPMQRLKSRNRAAWTEAAGG